MNNYQQVKALVDSGALSITYIDHLPRTISHALERSLFEIYDGQINEPFFSSKSNGTEGQFSGFDKPCAAILQEFRQCQQAQPGKKPVTLLIKDVSKSIPGKYWERWLDLTAHVVTLVRDPHLQLYSLMEAIANDHLNPGELKVTPELVLKEKGEAIAATLRRHGTAELNTTSWLPMGRHEEVTARYMQAHPAKSHIALDGNMLLLDPESTMRELVGRLSHVDFKPAMLTDWSKSRAGFPNERNWGHSETEGGNNSWTAHAFESEGFQWKAHKPVPVEAFPERIQRHISGSALPVYLNMLSHPDRVGPKDFAGVKTLVERPIDASGTHFKDAIPTSAYAYLAAAPTGADKEETLRQLRVSHPEYAKSFAAIDDILAGKKADERRPAALAIAVAPTEQVAAR